MDQYSNYPRHFNEADGVTQAELDVLNRTAFSCAVTLILFRIGTVSYAHFHSFRAVPGALSLGLIISLLLGVYYCGKWINRTLKMVAMFRGHRLRFPSWLVAVLGAVPEYGGLVLAYVLDYSLTQTCEPPKPSMKWYKPVSKSVYANLATVFLVLDIVWVRVHRGLVPDTYSFPVVCVRLFLTHAFFYLAMRRAIQQIESNWVALA